MKARASRGGNVFYLSCLNLWNLRNLWTKQRSWPGRISAETFSDADGKHLPVLYQQQ